MHAAFVSLMVCLLFGCFGLSATILPAAEPTPGDQTSTLWGDLRAGKHQVGFRVIFLSDPQRLFVPEPDSADQGSARQLRVFLWYPAAKNAQAAGMRFGDYFESQPASPEYAKLHELLRSRDQRTLGRQFTQKNASDLVARLLKVPVPAMKDALPARGRFPLVLHSLGRNDYQQESTVLWEYLASHGFVVAVVPQLGKSLAQSQLAFTLPDLQIQADDITFAWRQLGELDFIDANKVAITGHSSGGIAAILVAGADRRIRALVSLDGSISTPDGVRLLEKLNLREPIAPLLNLHRLAPKESLSTAFIDSLATEHLMNIGFALATHFDFQNWPVYSLLANEEDERSKAFRPAASGRAVFWTACEVTRLFLQATIRGERRAWSELRAASTRRMQRVVISEGTWQLPE